MVSTVSRKRVPLRGAELAAHREHLTAMVRIWKENALMARRSMKLPCSNDHWIWLRSVYHKDKETARLYLAALAALPPVPLPDSADWLICWGCYQRAPDTIPIVPLAYAGLCPRCWPHGRLPTMGLFFRS